MSFVPKDAVAGEEVVVVETNLGRMVFQFFPEVAPKHVESFKKLSSDGFYNGVKFHRIIPGFVIQGGDPNTKDKPRHLHGTGGPGYTVPAEFNEIPHTKGILSMARTSDPNSAGSQFFVCVDRVPHLDRQYTVFGRVIDGLDVVDKIVALKRDRNDNPLDENPAVMESVTVQTWPLA
ncbi:MAG: peptidylprolyl isomerase [Fimbriimonadaceae bacterium]|nr:peptidylprolyl isomerase [Fimbriimonadaceae bacterium]